MVKKTFSVILSVIIIICLISIPVNAFEPTGFDINAKNALLISLDTNDVLYSKGADEKVYPASITKIMTVILMLENPKYSPDSKIAMTDEVLKLISGTGSSVSLLKSGEEITELDLVYLILMASYGDCAYLAAIHYGGTVENFVDMMNQKANELGLTGTSYGNPVGLHDENTYTTATDTVKLTRYALKNETFKTVCEANRYTFSTSLMTKRTISTTNFLHDTATSYYYIYAKGVKTGYTDEAGRCLVSTASYNGYNYMCVLFGCTPNAGVRYEFVDSKNLYRWAFNNFKFKEVANTENPVCEVPVELSTDTDFVSLYVDKSFISVLPKEADDSTITIKAKPNAESFDAPIKKGDILGTADIIYAEQVIGTVNLVSGEDVQRSSLLFGIRTLKNFFSSIYMKLVYALAAIAVIVFIFMIIRLNAGHSKKRKVKYIPYNRKEENDDENYR